MHAETNGFPDLTVNIVICLQDLFAPTYPSSAPYPGWQTGPPQGYGFNMQYIILQWYLAEMYFVLFIFFTHVMT